MTILYVHGFGSKYDPDNEKIEALATIEDVVGVDIDYTRGFNVCLDKITDFVITAGHTINLIVGTSMGGYMASHVGAKLGIPFVALNPASNPAKSLEKWIGNHTTHYGDEFSLSERTVENFPTFNEDGYGVVLLDSSDIVISASETRKALDGIYPVHMFVGGNHRFAHIDEAIPIIKTHLLNASSSYEV